MTTVLHAIIQDAAHHPDVLAHHSLAFISVGATALPRQMMAELENLFHAPVLPVLGMTEAGILTSTPRPPRPRKYGSVGVAVGQRIRIIDQHGNECAGGQIGEVVVRGDAVIAGYENEPEANREAFIDGWFRTGDAGYLDEDGYLFLTGRFKEMINRGGEKVIPSEVEDVLLDHLAVAQATVFALPHATLGEDVGAAVVLRPGATATERDLRLFVGDRLAAFKVPRRIVFLDALPLSATGKPRRIGMAEQLGLDAVLAADYVGPRDVLEQSLTAIWARVLGVTPIGIHDNFFDLGGNSLLAAQACIAMEQVVGQVLPAAVLLEAQTIAQLIILLGQAERAPGPPTLVALQPSGPRPPLFCVAYVSGPALGFRDLAHLLGPQQPLYGLQETTISSNEMAEQTVEDIATRYVQAIRAVQPRGPYYLAGHSGGGVVAFEMAQQLQAHSEQVALLVLFDTPCPASRREPSWLTCLSGRVQYPLRMLATRIRFHAIVWTVTRSEERAAYLRERLATVCRKLIPGRASDDPAPMNDDNAVDKLALSINTRLLSTYVPRPYRGRVTLFWSSDNPLGRMGAADGRLGWRRMAQEGLEIHYLPGAHGDFVYHAPYLRQTIMELQACLRRARRGA